MEAVTMGIPASIQEEHQEIELQLQRASRIPGPVGEAARALAAVLQPHLAREQECALPPLALLGPLAAGELTPDMQAVLPLVDALRAELPRLLEEHHTIAAATRRLLDIARARGSASTAAVAEKLMRHAHLEEEVFYPAALLVGELVRAPRRTVML